MAKKNMFIYVGVSMISALAFLLFGLPSDLRSAQQSGSSKLGDASKGKTIFENQCSVCHTIGGGRETGPDLKGVTEKRPHKWLVEFIMNPEKMFKENDPTAEKLLNEYAGVKMPNLGLSKEQTNDVLAYVKEQSQ